MDKFKKVFRQLPDPRAANARHDLLEVLFIALAAMLCGAESCADMAIFGQSKQGLLRLFLRLEHGIPSHDTFSRVFRLLKPQAFESAFRRFMGAFAASNGLDLTGVAAVDGKALRGAYERGGRATPLHLVNVFAVEARMALAQQKAPGRNETAGALEVLELLSLEGCIVTADALHCHRAFAAAVLERGGDYVLAIKANRGRLYTAVTQQFARSGKRSIAERIDPSTHDRHEARRATVMRNTSLAALYGFPGAAAVGRITSRRRRRGQRADAVVVRYYLLSKYLSPKRLLHVTRSHWCQSALKLARRITVIGASRTSSIGFSMFISPRTTTAPEKTMLQKTSPFCAGSPSISCVPTQTGPLCVAKSSAPAGTMPSSQQPSVICDSPASSGGQSRISDPRPVRHRARMRRPDTSRRPSSPGRRPVR
ncbi:Predicted transposase YbfD/YdcC associated with H repeats [Rhizobiales bacterium GAS113]|nr:Predicted transposase YbfD/YdcC associated with H repeats [Rhizobiales bacterium GAS113]